MIAENLKLISQACKKLVDLDKKLKHKTMTREEQIKEAAMKDCAEHCNNRGYFSFVAGVKWADEHPKSPWIKFRDRRPDIMCLVLVYHDEEAFTAYFKEFDDGRYWRSNVGLVPVLDDDYWMLIPKLEEE